jgi:hypothetical protein
MDTKIALLLGALRKLEFHLLSTTTLLVLHDGAIFLALGCLLAGRAIRHGIVHLDISIAGH